jgi:hypothetical protein
MNSLYTDPEITAGYLNLMKLSYAASQSPDQANIASAACETFFESLIKRAYASLQDISPQPLPELHLHAWQGELDTLARLNAEATFADLRGVHVGLGFVSKLDAALLVLSAYLMDNYIWQVSSLEVNMLPASEPLGPNDTLMPLSMHTGRLPSVAEVVGLADFPAEALSLYSARLIPEAESRDGYQKRPFQLIMECFQEARLAADRRDGDIRTLTRAIPKPLIDLTDFCDRFDPGEAIQAYLDSDNGPYLLRLHLQLLLDGLYFLLAHEVEHYQLGHLEHRKALVPQMREEEAAADSASLALLRGIPGFQPRSLIIIFNFARSEQPDTPPDQLDHPLAHNRLLILTKTLLAEPGGDALRADVNAGLALLPSRFEPQFLTFGWPDEAPEDVDIYVSSYSDMDYTAHVMVYIDRPPRHPERIDGFTENAFLLAHLAYKIYFEVRDRVDPEKVYTWGGAGYQPTIRPEDLFAANRAATVFSRLHFSIPAPPEFCLKWTDAELAIKKIEVFYHEPDVRSREEGRNRPRFFYSPVELDLNNLLSSLPASNQDLTWRNRFLLAARRYLEYQQSDASIQIYQWLFRQDPESLPYGDLVNLVAQLMDSDRFAEAAEIARWAVGPGRVQRPRFHYILAMDHATHEDAQEAFEEIFLEMALFGEYGEMFDDAREMCGKIASYAGDPVMAALRDFMLHRDAADRSREQGKHEHALAEFRAGRDALLAGQRQAHRHFVFLRQLLSDVALAISELEGKGFDTATEAAQAVLALWPDFVPALMNLARIALLQGDRKTAHAIWQQAHVIAPFHSIAFEKREEFGYGLS